MVAPPAQGVGAYLQHKRADQSRRCASICLHTTRFVLPDRAQGLPNVRFRHTSLAAAGTSYIAVRKASASTTAQRPIKNQPASSTQGGRRKFDPSRIRISPRSITLVSRLASAVCMRERQGLEPWLGASPGKVTQPRLRLDRLCGVLTDGVPDGPGAGLHRTCCQMSTPPA